MIHLANRDVTEVNPSLLGRSFLFAVNLIKDSQQTTQG